MARVINFNAGPAALPLGALERAQKELLDISGSGMSVMEHSHRGKVYEAVHQEAIALVKELLSVPDNYEILFLQGGASQQFAVVPMNLLAEGKSADYILTGGWSQKAYKEAKMLGTVRVAGNTVSYVVNGTVVHSLARNAVTTDGIVGFRVNHQLDVAVEGFELQRS